MPRERSPVTVFIFFHFSNFCKCTSGVMAVKSGPTKGPYLSMRINFSVNKKIFFTKRH